MKAKQTKLPSDESILKKKDSLAEYLQGIADGSVTVQSPKETVTSKLALIGTTLMPLKDKGIAYTTLSKILFDQIGLKVSPQTLRAFCQDRLDFPKSNKANKRLPESTMFETDKTTKLFDQGE